MKKRILSLVFVLVLCIISALPAYAAEEPYFVDFAQLVSDSTDYETLENKLAEVSEENKMDVVIVTLETMDGMSGKDCAEQLHEDLGYASDCVMLVVSMEDRDVNVSSFGEDGREIISVSDCDSIREAITNDLSNGDYYDAFELYISEVEDTIYNYNHFNFGFNILISVGIGLVIAIIAVLVMKSQLKSVRFQSAAANYLKPGSMQVDNAYDNFLYRNVNKVAKPKNESSSGSGGSNSSSGKF